MKIWCGRHSDKTSTNSLSPSAYDAFFSLTKVWSLTQCMHTHADYTRNTTSLLFFTQLLTLLVKFDLQHPSYRCRKVKSNQERVFGMMHTLPGRVCWNRWVAVKQWYSVVWGAMDRCMVLVYGINPVCCIQCKLQILHLNACIKYTG